MVKPEWLGRYESSQLSVVSGQVITQSWDTAIKAGAHNDPSVCITFAQSEGQHYVVDVLRERLEYPQLRRKMIELAQKWNPQAVLVEDKASGQSLLQDLRQNTGLPLIACMPKLDKLTRFAAITPQIEAGRLLLPERASWLAEFEQELFSFPDSPHNDQVDALSQYLNWLRERERMGGMQVRRI
jgi:predicted phage terminase large subunit-like protein